MTDQFAVGQEVSYLTFIEGEPLTVEVTLAEVP